MSGPSSAVWLSHNASDPPEMTPARTLHAGMCGAGKRRGGMSQFRSESQPVLPNHRLKQDPRDTRGSAVLREEKTVRLRGIQCAHCGK